MPTVARVESYRFFFYSNEGTEPPHVHVQRDHAVAKFWLDPPVLASSTGFASHELSKLAKLVGERQAELQEAWHEFFGG